MMAEPDDEAEAEHVEDERVAEIERALPEVEPEQGLCNFFLEREYRVPRKRTRKP